MSDFFHADADAWRPEAWNVTRDCDGLDWLILTKRPQHILNSLPSDWGPGYPNVWLGVTCEARSSYWQVDTLIL
jgi:protein gp37